MSNDNLYGISIKASGQSGDAPALDYLPARPKIRPKIGLVGAGGITSYHLNAYKRHGLEVVAIADVNLEAAEKRRQEYFPDAMVSDNPADVFRRDDVEIVDIATHPGPRVHLIQEAIAAGKHILSQKPFVSDLDIGERLVELAEAKGVLLAVNQNGRWAPQFRYLSQAIRAELIGDVSSIDFVQQWDHTWTTGTPFEEIHHLLLYDFGIHWFDFTNTFTPAGAKAERVYATVRRTSFQKAKPPFLATAVIDYPHIQARISYNAHVLYGQEDRVIISGEKGTLRSVGDGYNIHEVFIDTSDLKASPKLQGSWFENGFEGTMLELISAMEEKRVPENNARDNLDSLALCFAAIRSADTGEPQVPGMVRKLGI